MVIALKRYDILFRFQNCAPIGWASPTSESPDVGHPILWDGLTVFAFGQDGLLQTAAQLVGQRVDLVLAVDFDGLPGGVQRDDAVIAAAEMFFEVGP